jgi:hypothetical protein
MCVFGGIITLSKFWVNIAAARKATARNVSLPTLTRSCFTGVGMAKTLPGPTVVGAAIFMSSSPVPAIMYCVSSVASGMPAEPFPRLDLINDRGRCGGAIAAIDGESASRMN